MNKSETPYEFAIGADTVQYVQLMIRERQTQGEKLSKESPLFRSYSVQSQYGSPNKIKYSKPGWPLSPTAAGQIIRTAATRAGIQEQHGKRYLFHPHGFRRYWKYMARRGGMNPDLIEYMLGHTLPHGGAYDRWRHEDIKREYSRAEKYMRIRPTFSKDKTDVNQEIALLRILFRSDSSRVESVSQNLGISPVQIRELLKTLKEKYLF